MSAEDFAKTLDEANRRTWAELNAETFARLQADISARGMAAYDYVSATDGIAPLG